MIQTADLPATNAAFNLASTVLITSGWILIRAGKWRAHIACMICAVATSSCFLAGYLVYHARVGEHSTHFAAGGIVRPLYFTMLISHIVLAAVTLPLVIVTLVPALRRRWRQHTRIARWTMPIWLYVSVTGVLVYLMLYRWFPPPGLARLP